MKREAVSLPTSAKMCDTHLVLNVESVKILNLGLNQALITPNPTPPLFSAFNE